MEYRLIRSKRRTAALCVTRDAEVLVRAPLRMSAAAIEQFVAQNTDWLEKHLADARSALGERERFTWADGDPVYILGAAYPLRAAPAGQPRIEDGAFAVPSGCDRAAALEAYLRSLAGRLLPERTAFYSARMGLVPTGVRITAAKTRWGSCSGKNSLCFSYRTACLPAPLIDAIVVHELAHIRHKNHSPRFYAEVQSILPDYPERRKTLQDFSRRLLTE